MSAEPTSGPMFTDAEAFAFALHRRYRLSPSDVEPTDAPGYWRRTEPCGGRAGGCREPIHTILFNDGPTFHTVSYFDHYRDEHGRWASPYRTWRAAVSAAPELRARADGSEG